MVRNSAEFDAKVEALNKLVPLTAPFSDLTCNHAWMHTRKYHGGYELVYCHKCKGYNVGRLQVNGTAEHG